MNKPVGTDAKKPNVGRHEIQQKKRVRCLDKYRQYRMLLVIGLIGLTLSLTVFFVVNRWETQLRKSDFEQLAESRCQLMENEIKWNIVTLKAIKHFFDASWFVERSEYATFIEPLHSQTYHTLSFYWAPRVLDSDRRSFEKAVQAEGYADFNVHCDSPTDSIAVITQHREYYPVLYHCCHSPLTMGFDISSRPNLRKAIEKAIDVDQSDAATSAILPNGQNDWPEIAFLYPVYNKHLPITTVEERRLAVKGIVAYVMQVGDMLDHAINMLSPAGINLELTDLFSTEGRQSLYQCKSRLKSGDTSDDLNEESEASGLVYISTFDIADRTWEVRATPSLGYLDANPIWVCWIMLVSGLLLTALLLIQLRSMQTRTIIVEKLVMERSVQLQENIKRFQLAFEIGNIAICLRDLDGYFTMVNDQMCTMYGYSREELLSMTMKDIAHPEDVHINHEVIQQGLLDEIDHNRFIKRYIHKDGHIIWGENSSSAVRNAKGDPIFFISYILDITERKQSEVDLHEEAIRRRILIDQSRDGIVVLKQDGSVYESNRRFAEMLGFSPEEVRNLYVWDWEFQCSPEQVREMLKNVDETGDYFETRHRRKDGSIYDVEISTNGAVFAGEKLIFCVCRDITERKRAEREIRRLAMIVEQTSDGIVVTDLDGFIQFANNTWAVMHGYESGGELVGGHINIFHTEEQIKTDVLPFNEGVMRLGHRFGEVGHKRRDGTTFPTLTTVTLMRDEQDRPCGLAGFVKDITERKKEARERKMLELEMNQARKLEAVGSLAAGIAHEINTPIQFVGDNTIFLYDSYKTLMSLLETYERLWQQVNAGGDLMDLCSEKVKADENADLEYLREEVPSAVEQALEGVHRVTKIVRAMKDFAHSDQGTTSKSNLNEMLESTLTVTRNELKYVADVETDFCQELPEYDCYRDDLNQVFLNLLVNAAHAIADVVGDASAGKGLITVSTLRDNDNILIRISDTGKGIPRSIRDRIFDPFFSTKDVGKGSGQGLSIARKIVVEKHQGSLDFETEEGKGTTFIIRLPVSTHEKTVEVT